MVEVEVEVWRCGMNVRFPLRAYDHVSKASMYM